MADACDILAVAARPAPPGVSPVAVRSPVNGPALPVRHLDSVDEILGALKGARSGDVLVVDDAGNRDQACIGDLVVLEAQRREVAAVVVWGSHRDAEEIAGLTIAVFSCGPCPPGPRAGTGDRASPGPVRVGEHEVASDDVVCADRDGVLFVPGDAWPEVAATAADIVERERQTARRIRGGDSLLDVLDYAAYESRRNAEPSYTFRDHLRELGAAIEA